jgi:hypothetical protein
MRYSFNGKVFILAILQNFVLVAGAFAWSEHPLICRPALKDHRVWEKHQMVNTKSLFAFLMETEKELEVFLKEHETWSVTHLPNYTPQPANLVFLATGTPGDVVNRFCRAIRINPGVKVPLYLHLLPDGDPAGRAVADPRDITTLKDLGAMATATYVTLAEGESVSCFDVLCTANDEPDYGFDLGLFSDNGTVYGAEYGFGEQPFGNPNLEYSSQAPFHMGFFHEAKVLYTFGPFLKKTYIDYRIFLYKALSEFAFKHNQPYWGWRFMGWGMHYMGDVSMPYHTKPLPGVSTARMIWINLKSMMGAPGAKNRAIQLVSNRHTVFEEYQLQVLRKAYREKDARHPFFAALAYREDAVPFSYEFVISRAMAGSAEAAGDADKTLERCVPARMVSDAGIEVSELEDLKNIAGVVRLEGGLKAEEEMICVIAQQMKSYGMYLRTYLDAIVESSGL